MNFVIRIAALLLCACLVPAVVFAQESAAGNAVAEQLAQSSLRMIGSMLAVLALVGICTWALRRWRERQGGDGGSIEIVSGVSLGSKDRIVLLRVGEEQVLVGVSAAGMRSLHVVKSSSRDDLVAAPVEALPGDFAMSLEAARQ